MPLEQGNAKGFHFLRSLIHCSADLRELPIRVWRIMFHPFSRSMWSIAALKYTMDAGLADWQSAKWCVSFAALTVESILYKAIEGSSFLRRECLMPHISCRIESYIGSAQCAKPLMIVHNSSTHTHTQKTGFGTYYHSESLRYCGRPRVQKAPFGPTVCFSLGRTTPLEPVHALPRPKLHALKLMISLMFWWWQCWRRWSKCWYERYQTYRVKSAGFQ